MRGGCSVHWDGSVVRVVVRTLSSKGGGSEVPTASVMNQPVSQPAASLQPVAIAVDEPASQRVPVASSSAFLDSITRLEPNLRRPDPLGLLAS